MLKIEMLILNKQKVPLFLFSIFSIAPVVSWGYFSIIFLKYFISCWGTVCKQTELGIAVFSVATMVLLGVSFSLFRLIPAAILIDKKCDVYFRPLFGRWISKKKKFVLISQKVDGLSYELSYMFGYGFMLLNTEMFPKISYQEIIAHLVTMPRSTIRSKDAE